MTDAEKRAQARASRMTLHKGHLGQPIADESSPSGSDGISLAYRLTRASYAMAGQPLPAYPRDQIPCRFVPWSSR
jgi:hypothetical protein